ncbi:HDOD domain-containing protein [Spongiibacter taiwanensis]|uniref:HDOD domain-containing protein n=1 Tax=Spongiibacter taiwanensis TaxID=1748242 RepID=UPI002035E8D8|nr:HDOD domain-containing protein [Spongiibacter taiwanensis]USA43098.1 HDOD domain-containing protein [Spongiibacter taiwanensis]
MSQVIGQIRSDIIRAIEDDSIVLPTLPEVALEVREAASDPDVSIPVLATIIEHDSSLAARILRVSNSSLLRAQEPVVDVKTAISRIGLSYTSTLVTALAMQQIFLSTKENLNARMRALWVHSTDVAAICNTLAKSQRHLKPELATLAGIIHQIGALPLLNYAVGRGFLRDHPTMLDQVLVQLAPEIGTRILESWGFAPELVNVPVDHLKFDREVDRADYADLVTVANLHSYVGTQHPFASVNWADVTAFARLGLPVDPAEEDAGYREQIERMQEALRA